MYNPFCYTTCRYLLSIALDVWLNFPLQLANKSNRLYRSSRVNKDGLYSTVINNASFITYRLTLKQTNETNIFLSLNCCCLQIYKINLNDSFYGCWPWDSWGIQKILTNIIFVRNTELKIIFVRNQNITNWKSVTNIIMWNKIQ